MSLIPSRRSKRQRLTRAAGKTAKKAAKARAVQEAPKTAAALWTGKRSGTILKAVAASALVALVVRKLRGGGEDVPPFAPPQAPEATSANGTGESYRTTPTPVSSQQTEGGGASGPDPAGPTTTAQAKDDLRQTAPGTTAAPGPGGAAATGGDLGDTAPGAAPAEGQSATPPHGDPLADDARES